MEKITHHQFQTSLFNIGAGKDTNLLLRFAHLTDSFIYTNLYISKEEIRSWYREQFFLHPDFELIEKAEIVNFGDAFFEADHFSKGFINPVFPFDTKTFLEDYQRVFYKSRQEANWLLYFEVKFRPLNKVLKLYYYHGEGLATYLALSKGGQLAPRILVTIQTGFLEYPERHLDSFFARHAQPMTWVRGFEGDYCYRYSRCTQLNPKGLFGEVGMSFNHQWHVGNYDGRSQNNIRFCKAFIKQETAAQISSKGIQQKYHHPKDRFSTKAIGSNGQNTTNALYVITKKVKHQLPEDTQIWYWEDISPVNDVFYPLTRAGAQTQLEALGKRLSKCKVSKETVLHLIPFCLESEGRVYFEALGNLPYASVSYAPSPLDFLDLKMDINQELNQL